MRKSRSLDVPVVVDEKNLTALVKSLPGYPERVQYNVGFSDGAELYPESIEKILEFPNTKSAEICSISVRTSISSGAIYASLELRSGPFNTVNYVIEGDAEEVTAADLRITPRLESVIERSFLGLFRIESQYFVSTGAFFVGLMVSCFADFEMFSGGSARRLVALIALSVLALVVAFSGAFIRRALKFLYPKIVFKIGDGVARYERVIDARKILWVTIVLGLLISLVAGLIANLI